MVLYRKYRPKTFSEVIGQEHIVRTLSNAIEENLISHAYLFAGPWGSGKTTLARLFAKAINCENRKGYEPCNECLSCREINEGRAIDLIEIDAASNRGIEEIRQLKEGAKFSPTRLKYKVFIIDEAHQLSKDAANALLKILEEPPEHVIFILATTEPQKMIPTIISRCQRFDFYKLTLPQILRKLQFICENEKIKIEDEALELIAGNSNGAMRDAESFLEQVITYAKTQKVEKITQEIVKEILGLIDINIISKFLDFLIEKKPGVCVEFLNKEIEKGLNPFEFAKTLLSYLRSGLILKIDPNLNNLLLENLTKEARDKLKQQIERLKENDLRRMLKVFLEAQNKMKYSPIPQLPLELAIVEVTESLSD
ncbi:MAG: DNA polymerase III subunit gamma/tau [Candidatus Pacebacteria bacterium]|nr:DNA polymerase III subunit gamma/tau [Candidatus Paceibacterota bacterium]